MENASKALTMAAGILIGLLIISLAVYLFSSFASTSTQIHDQIAETQTNQFNAQFTSYVGKEGITIYDVITVVNLAKDSNEYYGLGPQDRLNEGTFYITITLEPKSGAEKTKLELMSKSELDNLIREDIRSIQGYDDMNQIKLKNYECNVKVNSTTKLVNHVIFSEI